MLRSIFAASLVILALLIAAGCSDDDECPSCPTNVDTVTVTETVTDSLTDTLAVTSPRVLVSGYFRVESGELDPWIEIFSVDGAMPVVDSVVGGGELMRMEAEYDNATPNYQLDDPLVSGGWQSGDIFEVTVYTPEGSATCEATALDYDTDFPQIIDWALDNPYDTVDVSDEIVVAWHPVAGADWYTYYLSHYYDSSGQRQYAYTRHYTSDTSFTIAADDNASDGYWYISIYSIAGPYPDDADGNFVGNDAIKGVLLSYAYDWVYIYVGTGDPGDWAVSKTAVAEERQDQIRDILDRFDNR